MNFEFDGTFPAHQPDPLNFDNLKDLRKSIGRKSGFWVGTGR